MADAAAETPPPSTSTGGSNKLVIVVVIVNLIALFAVIGIFVKTRILFKRPAITEHQERARIAEPETAKSATGPAQMVNFNELGVNIRVPDSNVPRFVKLSFALEVRDEKRMAEIERFRPIIVDKVISFVGRKSYEELVTVQGRYLLRTQILEGINELLSTDLTNRTSAVTAVYITHFSVE
jgi:flagellar FliL protein